MITRASLRVCALVYIQTDFVVDVQSLEAVATSALVFAGEIDTDLLATTVILLALIDIDATGAVVVSYKPITTFTLKTAGKMIIIIIIITPLFI